MVDKNFILGYGAGKASAGPPITIEALSITANGEYTASTGRAYSPVTANVPNTYVAADEGKVVSNGALVSQTSVSVTQNGTIDTTLNNSVVVNVQGGGSDGGVTFYDYDGTVVQRYSASEFANLSAMPANPTHTGLTAKGWNWTLTKAKTYVAAYGKLNIGQMYVTDDGKTRIYIKLEEGRLAPYFGIGVNGTCDIDWGDGSTHDTLTGTKTSTRVAIQHTYATAGEYVIVLNVGNGELGFVNGLFSKNATVNDSADRVYVNSVVSVEMGSSVTSINNNAFSGCYSLTSVTIPDTVISTGDGVFFNCYSLTSVTIPDTVTSIGVNAFSGCYSLTSVTIPDSVTSINNNIFYNCCSLTSVTIPDGVTSIGTNAFYYCYSLISVIIPDSVTSIGNSAFYYCHSLTSVIIPDNVTSIGSNIFYNCYSLTSVTIPDNVTSINTSTFYNCYSLTSVTIPDTVTSIRTSAFSGCYSLTSVTIPNGVKSIGDNAFYNCYSLTSITIPNSVTSIGASAFYGCSSITSVSIPDTVTSIGASVFYSCPSITSVIIPDSVTSIGSNAFYNCYGLGYIKFSSAAPPTVSASNAFNNVPTDCIIYIPSGSLASYTGATNYPSSSTYTYVEY